MKALILLADGFEDMQFFCSWFRLQEEGIEVTVAGSTAQTVTGQHGYKFEPDMPIHELSPSEYDLSFNTRRQRAGKAAATRGSG